MDSTRTSPDVALAECCVAVETGIGNTSQIREELLQFIELFRGDFTTVLCKEENAWITDRAAVLALARAIGAYAAFLALSDKSQAVGFAELQTAFEKLAPECELRELRRKYCESLTKAAGAAGNRT